MNYKVLKQFDTAEIADAHPGLINAIALPWRSFAGRHHFHGAATTVRTKGDPTPVRVALERPGGGGVLVIDGALDVSVAVIGDRMSALAASNNWQGIILAGAVRDVHALRNVDIGLFALGSVPVRSALSDHECCIDREVMIAGTPVRPGDWIYADEDGVLCARQRLPLD